jgi:hypothetical protein
MQESHEKGVAIPGPEFCTRCREVSSEAKKGKRWAGYRAAKMCNQCADAVTQCGRPHDQQRDRELLYGPALVGDPTNVWKLYAREPGDLTLGRWVKATAIRLACPSSKSRTAKQYQ